MADPTTLTADDILDAAKRPTADELLDAPRKGWSGFGLDESSALSGPILDSYASGTNPMSQALNAFAHGAKEGWGEGSLTPLTDEATEFLKKSGVFNDWQSKQRSLVKTFNEALMRPPALAMEATLQGILRAGTALHGGLVGAAEQGGPVGALAGPLAAGIEAFPFGARAVTGIPHGIPNYAEARAMGLIGPSAETAGDAEIAQALRPQIEEQAKQSDQSIALSIPDEPAPPTEIPPEIHAAARQIAPDLFNEYDALTAQREAYRRFMRNPTEDLDAEIDDLRARRLQAPPKERAALANQITALEDERAKVVEGGNNTPEMRAAQDAFQRIDQRMRDLGPQVNAAYREAQTQGGTSFTMVEPTSPVDTTPALVEPELPRPTIEPVPDIAADVSRQLVAAGRPQEEADVIAALQEARYRARAENLRGTTPEQLYAEEGPDIQGGLTGGRGGMAAGRTTLEDSQRTITLFERADASTAIHELGHSYLEELIQDAADDRATAAVRADASTIRQWLGAAEDERITTRQHEKFARGFERYMMEGTAPSRALEGVFAKFKEWLTGIYQTVAKLRSPITDDIRRVFDRMLTPTERETVIAPEREPVSTVADRHEEIADRTPPLQAEVAADEVRQQVADAAQQEGISDAIEGRRGTGAGGGEAAGTQPDRGTTPAGTVAREERTLEPAGTVEPRGGALAPQSAGSLRRGEPPTDPNQPFRDEPNPNIDKAGNIRLDNLNVPEQIDQVIRDAAARNSDFLPERRGVLSDAEVLSLSDAIGRDPEFLNRHAIGEAYNAEEVLTIRRLLVQSANDVREAMRTASEGTDVDVMELAKAIARHEMIQGKAAQATAEWGRAGRSFRMLMDGSAEAEDLNAFLKENTGRDLFQLRRMAELGANLRTPGQIGRFIDATAAGKLKQAVIFYYVNALISGPITHLRYAVGNAINAVVEPLLQTPAAAYGATREAMGLGTENRVYLRETGAQLYALGEGFRNALPAALDAWKTGQSVIPGRMHVMTPFGEGLAIPPIPGVVGKAIAIPGRSVASIHSFFLAIRYEQEIARLAMRQALTEGLNGPLRDARIGELSQTPTKAMMDSATQTAMRQLYMGKVDYDSFLGGLTRWSNDHLLPKIMMPFLKIGSQIMGNMLEYTPLAPTLPRVRAALMAGNATTDIALAKMTAGTALIGTMAGLVMQEMATGDGPDDPNRRAVWLLDHQPNSIKVGGLWIPYERLGHLGMLLRFTANMTAAVNTMNDDQHQSLAAELMHGVAKSILDETFLRGVKDMLDGMFHFNEYGDQYLRNFATNWLPFSIGLGQVARAIDPDQRQMNSAWDSVKAHVPWVSETLQPRYDRFGRAIPSHVGLPTYLDQLYANDPAVHALERLQLGVSPVPKQINGIALTPEQYGDFQRVGGLSAKRHLDQVVGTPGFADFPRHIQITLVQRAVEAGHKEGSAYMLMKYPDVLNPAIEINKDLSRGLKPRGGYEQVPGPTVH